MVTMETLVGDCYTPTGSPTEQEGGGRPAQERGLWSSLG